MRLAMSHGQLKQQPQTSASVAAMSSWSRLKLLMCAYCLFVVLHAHTVLAVRQGSTQRDALPTSAPRSSVELEPVRGGVYWPQYPALAPPARGFEEEEGEEEIGHGVGGHTAGYVEPGEHFHLPNPRLTGPRFQETTVAQSDLFDNLDANNDNIINNDELRHFIEANMDTNDFDTREEIEEATLHAMTTAQIHDDNSDSIRDTALSSKDMQLYWDRLGNFMSVDEVALWVCHAVQLPQYEDVFRANSITGYDFPALLENNGQSLQEDLGITKKLHRRQIMRAIQMKLLGLGDDPLSPPVPLWSATCTSVTIKWLPPTDNGVAVHKSILQRRDNDFQGWRTVYMGPNEWYTDHDVQPGVKYLYRLQAWNALGHSNFTLLADVQTLSSCHNSHAHGSNSSDPGSEPWSLWTALSTAASYLQHTLTLLTLAVFGYRVRQHMRLNAAGSSVPSNVSTAPTGIQSVLRAPSVHALAGQGQAAASAIPPMDTLNVADGTRAISTALAQANAADASPMPPDHSRCCVCRKKFSTARHRRKHHCSVCQNKFCSNHGYTPHLPFTSCTVPSSCICHTCLHR